MPNTDAKCPVCGQMRSNRQAIIDHMLREHVYPCPRWPVQIAVAGGEYGPSLFVLCNDGTIWGEQSGDWVQFGDIPQVRLADVGDKQPTESARTAVMRQAIEIACSIIETGDQRLLASDGPAGNQVPAISLGEWRTMYETLNRVRKL